MCIKSQSVTTIPKAKWLKWKNKSLWIINNDVEKTEIFVVRMKLVQTFWKINW